MNVLSGSFEMKNYHSSTKKCQLIEENFEYVLKQSLQATQNYKLQVSESLFDLSQLSASRFSKEGSDQSRLV